MSDLGLWTGLNQAVQNTTATGMQLLQLRQQREHQQALQAQSAAQLQETRLQHQNTNTYQQGMLAETAKARAIQQQAETRAQEEFYTKNPEAKPWNMPEFTNFVSQLKMAKVPVEDLPMFQDLQEAAKNPNLKVGHIAQMSVQKWPEWKEAANESLYNKALSLSGKASELPENDPKRKEILAQLDQTLKTMKIMDSITPDKVKEIFFQSIHQKEMGAKAELLKQQAEFGKNRYIPTDQGLYDVVEKRVVEGTGKIPPTPQHGVTEITAPDGKTAQKMQYNQATNAYDIPVGSPYPVKSQVININTAIKEAEGFKSWTPEAQNQAFMYNLITKEPPVSTRGMMAGDRQAYAKAYSQWQVDKGFSAQDIALMQADYRAGDTSLKNMARQEAPMSAFVGNINKQIDKVKQLYDNNDRIGIRLLDKPIRDIKVLAKGSGEEAVKASYLLEISNEIGKLSSGASASVQQLSDSAKEDWKKVHDPNLSFKEIMKVVNATRDQANMRMVSWREAKQEVRSALGFIGTTNTPVTTGFDIDAITAELNRRKGGK